MLLNVKESPLWTFVRPSKSIKLLIGYKPTLVKKLKLYHLTQNQPDELSSDPFYKSLLGQCVHISSGQIISPLEVPQSPLYFNCGGVLLNNLGQH